MDDADNISLRPKRKNNQKPDTVINISPVQQTSDHETSHLIKSPKICLSVNLNHRVYLKVEVRALRCQGENVCMSLYLCALRWRVEF